MPSVTELVSCTYEHFPENKEKLGLLECEKNQLLGTLLSYRKIQRIQIFELLLYS
jgi:hypothetical protein